MKMMLNVAILLIALMLVSQVMAQTNLPATRVERMEIQGLTPSGEIPSGGTPTLVIPVHFTNTDQARTAFSNGWDFHGDVEYSSVTGEFSQTYPWNWDIAFSMGCYPPACYPYFDQGTFIVQFNTPFDPDPDIDGVGFAGLTGAMGTGLPPGFDGIACYITLTDVHGEPGDVLVMDSTWWEPANYWLWTGVGDDVSWNGPHEFWVEGSSPLCPEVYTTCWPQPTVLKALENDRILEFYVYCEDPMSVDFASFRVNNIPNYLNDGIAVYDEVNERILTNAFIMRFLGASGFRPVPSEGIQSTYTLTYDKTDGSSVSLVGDFVLTVYQGDVNFDTEINIEDIVFLSDYLFQDSGQKAELFGYEMDECMDVDASGRFDLLDIQHLIQIVGI